MNTKRKFSLVELLLVVGIILVLASLLLAGMSRVENTLQGVRCLSNMRQVGMAFFNYIQDSNDSCPTRDPDDETVTDKNYTQQLLHDRYLFSGKTFMVNSQKKWPEFFRCPSYYYDSQGDYQNGSVTDAGLGFHQGEHGYGGRVISVVKRPFSKIIAMDWMASYVGGSGFGKMTLPGSPNQGYIPGTARIGYVNSVSLTTAGNGGYSWQGARKDFVSGRHLPGMVNILYFDASARTLPSREIGRDYYTPTALPGRAIHRWGGHPNGLLEAQNNAFNLIED